MTEDRAQACWEAAAGGIVRVDPAVTRSGYGGGSWPSRRSPKVGHWFAGVRDCWKVRGRSVRGREPNFSRPEEASGSSMLTLAGLPNIWTQKLAQALQ